MVSVNVAQLLLSAPGAVREFDFVDVVPAVSSEVHLDGPLAGHARLTRTNDGILVQTEYAAGVALECSRCLDEVHVAVKGAFDEEFLQSVDLRTGYPIEVPEDDELSRIDEHHEIELDEVLRQDILASLPIKPLCDATCPGLCATCGERLSRQHRVHAEPVEDDVPLERTSPFAGLANMLNDSDRPER